MSLVIRYIRCLYKIHLKEHENKNKKVTSPDVQMIGLEDMVCDFFFLLLWLYVINSLVLHMMTT